MTTAMTPEEIKEFALNPKKAKNENGEMEMHSLGDMVALAELEKGSISNGKAIKMVCGGHITNTRGSR